MGQLDVREHEAAVCGTGERNGVQVPQIRERLSSRGGNLVGDVRAEADGNVCRLTRDGGLPIADPDGSEQNGCEDDDLVCIHS